VRPIETLEPRKLLAAPERFDQLHVGNSHLVGVTEALDLLAADAGIIGHSTVQANIGGSTLKTHYFNPWSTNLITAPTGVGQIYLMWTDNATKERGYLVEAAAGGESFKAVDVLAGDATSARIGGLEPDASYTFRVVARNGAGNSAAATASATTVPAVGRYLQSSDAAGRIIFEAERPTTSQAGDAVWSGISWLTNGDANASGDVIAIEENAAPVESAGDVSTYAGRTPTLAYDITFDAAGSYDLFVRADGPDAGTDSFWVTLDGPVIGLHRPNPGLAWRDTSLSLNISEPGTRTLGIVTRESETVLDKFVLVPSDSSFVPTSTGPTPKATTTVPDASDNSLHVGLNGNAVATSGRWKTLVIDTGAFSGNVAVEIAQREDGTKLRWLELENA
jgi:hypothetical protein